MAPLYIASLTHMIYLTNQNLSGEWLLQASYTCNVTVGINSFSVNCLTLKILEVTREFSHNMRTFRKLAELQIMANRCPTLVACIQWAGSTLILLCQSVIFFLLHLAFILLYLSEEHRHWQVSSTSLSVWQTFFLWTDFALHLSVPSSPTTPWVC